MIGDHVLYALFVSNLEIKFLEEKYPMDVSVFCILPQH